MGSKSFSLAKDDWIKIGKGALIAAAGAALAVIAEQAIPALQGSGAAGAIMASVLAIAVNAVRKWIMDTTEGK